MPYTALNVTAPHVTAYDSDYPTRSTENYSHALHDILQDMEDAAGTWYLSDNFPSTTEKNTIRTQIWTMIEAVWDYANDAITNYRSTGSPSLTKPSSSAIATPTENQYPVIAALQWKVHCECQQMMFKIYYMWESEEDPLLLKEKLQELLIAWPLLDTTIELQNDMGQSFKVYPSWKNCDLDL